jgi:large subunit ribosomal protein L22
VRLRGDKLKQLAEAKGVTRDALAAAIVRTGILERNAGSAVDNWLAGRDHPRCKPADIAHLAEATGCEVREIVRFTSQVFHHRGSPRKAKLVVDLVRGRPVDEALNLLAFTPKRAALNVRKALSAAIADAEQAEADVTALYVAESRCDDAPRIKRFQPKDRGRAHAILKRLSHITITVQERDAKTSGGRSRG